MNDGNEGDRRFQRAAASLEAPEPPAEPRKPPRKYTIYEARRILADTAAAGMIYGPAVLSAVLGPDTINEIHLLSMGTVVLTAGWWLPKGITALTTMHQGRHGVADYTRIALATGAISLTANALTGLLGDAIQWTAWTSVAAGIIVAGLTGLRGLAAGGSITLPNGEDPLG